MSQHDDPTRSLAEITAWLEAHTEELVALRRHLHAHPELSGEEVETTQLLFERLSVSGLEPRVLSTGTGLVCDLGPPTAARTVALRADIDALAMDDEKEVAYRSTRAGIAHACGHDVHTAVVLGAGLALQRVLQDDPGSRLRLIFQPAEERLPGGAPTVIEEGGLEGVDAIFAVHCDPKLDVGRVGLRVGPITSATDMMAITLVGPGGHTARPERTADLLGIAALVVLELEGEVERRLGGRPINIVFGAISGGHAPNVIPSRAEMLGTIRTPEPDVWDEVGPMMEEALRTIVEPRGARFELEYTRGHPPVVNDAWATSVAEQAAMRVLDAGAVVPAPQSVGGDDYSWYLEKVPGTYIRLGVRDPQSDDPPPDLHASRFDVDERCIPVGVRLLAATALNALSSP